MCDQHSPTQGHLNYYAWKRGKGAMMSHFNQRRQLESFTTFCLCLEGHKGSGLSLHTAKSHFAVGCIITQELFHTPQKRRMLYHHCKTKLNQFVLAWVEHYTYFFVCLLLFWVSIQLKCFQYQPKLPTIRKDKWLFIFLQQFSSYLISSLWFSVVHQTFLRKVISGTVSKVRKYREVQK